MRKLNPRDLFSHVNNKDPSSFVYCFAPIEPYTANPIVRELAGINGAQLLFRPKINPFHLLKSKIWQEYEKIDGMKEIKTPNGRPVYDGCQIMARHDDPIKDSVRFISKNKKTLGISFIDLNFSCPGHNVLPHNRGGALLTKPKKLRIVIEKTLKFSSLPVSVKIRNGFEHTSSCKPICKVLNDYDLAWVTINRAPVKREKVDFKALKEDYSAFKLASQVLDDIPIVVNGDFDIRDRVEKLKDIPKCKGVMIARGALGNPLIFQEMTLKQKIQTQDEKNGIIKENLRQLFVLVSKYDNLRSKDGRRLWTSFGQLKRVIFFFIKQYYEKKGELLPAGFGENSFIRQTRFSRKSFIDALSDVFPPVEKEKWDEWIPNYDN